MSENRSILIVDDDEAILQLFELVGNKFGVQTVVAQNGSEALLKFEKQAFRLVITDLRMPKMNGDEFIKRVRQNPKHKNFPFVIITANLKDFDSKIALLDRVHVLEKPIKLGSIQKIYTSIFGPPKTDLPEKLPPVVEHSIEKISVLLEVLMKEKPNVTQGVYDTASAPPASHFLVHHPIFNDNKIYSLTYFFDQTLASKITSSLNPLYTGEIGQTPIMLEALKKMTTSLAKKIQESVNSVHPSSIVGDLLTVTGTEEATSKTTFGKSGNVPKIQFKTSAGTLELFEVMIETQIESSS